MLNCSYVFSKNFSVASAVYLSLASSVSIFFTVPPFSPMWVAHYILLTVQLFSSYVPRLVDNRHSKVVREKWKIGENSGQRSANRQSYNDSGT